MTTLGETMLRLELDEVADEFTSRVILLEYNGNTRKGVLTAEILSN